MSHESFVVPVREALRQTTATMARSGDLSRFAPSSPKTMQPRDHSRIIVVLIKTDNNHNLLMDSARSISLSIGVTQLHDTDVIML
jgi:hypothetical protein